MQKLAVAVMVVGISGNILLMFILVMLKQIAELIKDVDDNLDEVESTIERANR